MMPDSFWQQKALTDLKIFKGKLVNILNNIVIE